MNIISLCILVKASLFGLNVKLNFKAVNSLPDLTRMEIFKNIQLPECYVLHCD